MYSSVIEPVKVYISIIGDYMMFNKNPSLSFSELSLGELNLVCVCPYGRCLGLSEAGLA